MAIYQLGLKKPQVAASAYVTESAAVVGDVHLGEHSSEWFNVAIRADNDTITIGANTNVQEGAVLHTDPGFPLTLAENVTIGHQAMLHGCTVGAGTLIGIQAVILNGAKIGKNCLVGAGALVTEGKEFPDGHLILGTPAKAVRALTPEVIANLARIADDYAKRAQQFKTELKRLD
jgi:carbonic anhydrase/acetyltransferase-like protein (isoleucine patch superfamily)